MIEINGIQAEEVLISNPIEQKVKATMNYLHSSE